MLEAVSFHVSFNREMTSSCLMPFRPSVRGNGNYLVVFTVAFAVIVLHRIRSLVGYVTLTLFDKYSYSFVVCCPKGRFPTRVHLLSFLVCDWACFITVDC